MKRLVAIALIAISTSACAQHGHHRHGYIGYNGDAYRGFAGGMIVGAVIGPIFRPAPPPVIIYQPAPVYAPPPPVTQMYGNQCPIVDGYQTVPILKTNRYGYPERVGCGYPQ